MMLVNMNNGNHHIFINWYKASGEKCLFAGQFNTEDIVNCVLFEQLPQRTTQMEITI